MGRKRQRVTGMHHPDYLGREIPPRGFLVLKGTGTEITCTSGRYYLDPGHKRKGHHLVVVDGELYEVSELKPDEVQKVKTTNRNTAIASCGRSNRTIVCSLCGRLPNEPCPKLGSSERDGLDTPQVDMPAVSA